MILEYLVSKFPEAAVIKDGYHQHFGRLPKDDSWKSVVGRIGGIAVGKDGVVIEVGKERLSKRKKGSRREFLGESSAVGVAAPAAAASASEAAAPTPSASAGASAPTPVLAAPASAVGARPDFRVASASASDRRGPFSAEDTKPVPTIPPLLLKLGKDGGHGRGGERL